MSERVATTQWSQVLAARDGSDTEARRALEALCQTYWQPIYVYIRHQGSDPDEAGEDHRQRFESLKPYLTGEEPRKPYREVGAELGMTELAVRKAAHRLRRRSDTS